MRTDTKAKHRRRRRHHVPARAVTSAWAGAVVSDAAVNVVLLSSSVPFLLLPPFHVSVFTTLKVPLSLFAFLRHMLTTRMHGSGVGYGGGEYQSAIQFVAEYLNQGHLADGWVTYYMLQGV